MLFKARITKDIIKDEDKLVEQLYIFLDEFVRVKLRYESRDTQEDCIQDTIMKLLERSKGLTDTDIESLNLEQFFYNRANSYISAIFLAQLNKYRTTVISVDSFNKRVIGNFSENSSDSILSLLDDRFFHKEEEHQHIDQKLLTGIIKTFNLGIDEAEVVDDMAKMRLADLGLHSYPNYALKYNKGLDIIVLSVVDEYLLKTLGRPEWQ